MHEWNDHTGKEHAIDPTVFLSDGHCNYSPGGKFMLYDSYPDKERYQHLFTYSLANRQAGELGKLYSYDRANLDIHCDLYPRWNRAGNIISLDSNHKGARHIYELHVDNFK